MKIWVPLLMVSIVSILLSTAIHKPEEAFVKEGSNVIEAYVDAATDFNKQAMNGQEPQMNMEKIEAAKKHASEQVQKAGDEGTNILLNMSLGLLIFVVCGGTFLLVFLKRMSRY
jgi:F0F1-type ATP synthase membrane subunit b/b'